MGNKKNKKKNQLKRIQVPVQILGTPDESEMKPDFELIEKLISNINQTIDSTLEEHLGEKDPDIGFEIFHSALHVAVDIATGIGIPDEVFIDEAMELFDYYENEAESLDEEAAQAPAEVTIKPNKTSN